MSNPTSAKITLKEVYERLIALEVKYDMKIGQDKRVQTRFTWYVVFMSLLTLVDIILSIYDSLD